MKCTSDSASWSKMFENHWQGCLFKQQKTEREKDREGKGDRERQRQSLILIPNGGEGRDLQF